MPNKQENIQKIFISANQKKICIEPGGSQDKSQDPAFWEKAMSMSKEMKVPLDDVLGSLSDKYLSTAENMIIHQPKIKIEDQIFSGSPKDITFWQELKVFADQSGVEVEELQVCLFKVFTGQEDDSKNPEKRNIEKVNCPGCGRNVVIGKGICLYCATNLET